MIAVALLTCTPFFWKPLRGQSPGERISRPEASKERSRKTTDKSVPDQIGTTTRPLIVDTEGHIKTPEETANTQEETARTREIERRTINASEQALRYSFWTTLATWVLAAVGVGGTIAAIVTLRQIKRQADLAENSMIVAHRAYVGIESIVLKLPEHRTMDFDSWISGSHVEIVLRNTGVTRAKEFEFRYAFYVDDQEPRPIAVVMKNRQARAFNPNSALTIRSPLMGDMFTTLHTNWIRTSGDAPEPHDKRNVQIPRHIQR